ncbi:MAG: ABC transporter ATP-binding protein, partial [Ardenticatenales bacterium]|nr:ABC transporter ATP-binding protein [Ardenticatenales bacterium]
MTTAVEFRNVSRRFMLSHSRPRSLQEAMIRLLSFRRPPLQDEEFWALKGVSFTIGKGQLVGLIGTNGSGKSTALKMMAGILPPTGGEIVVNGRLSALLELGSGMHPDLTGRENIFLNGSLLGISNGEMQQLYPKIVSFSELGRFIDMPIKHYSSGMYMRLGFSVAVHVQPDILLLDEVLTVGDQSFQAKCLEHLYDMRRRGTTIVLVSHGLESLRTICTELIWLKDGELMQQGSPSTVSEAYLREIHRSTAQMQQGEGAEEDSFLRWGSGELEIKNVRMVNGKGKATDTFLTGDSFKVEIDY